MFIRPSRRGHIVRRHTGRWRILMFAACASSVALGCSGSDKSTEPADVSTTTPDPGSIPSDRPIELVDAGEDPRIELRVSPVAGERIVVTASEESEVKVGETTTNEEHSATYELASTIESDGDGIMLQVEPTLQEVDLDGSTPDFDGIGTWVWQLDDTGVVIAAQPAEQVEQVGQVPPDLRELLSFRSLLLAVPTEAVGRGARWRQAIDGSGDARLVVDVVDLTDEVIEVRMELSTDFDGGSFTSTTTGTFDLVSLLPIDVTSESTLTASSDVVDNGVEQTLDGTQHSTRTFTRVEE